MNLQQRIDDCLDDMANAYDYDDRQELLTDFIEMELQDQRQMCANNVREEFMDSGPITLSYRDYMDACINAEEQK